MARNNQQNPSSTAEKQGRKLPLPQTGNSQLAVAYIDLMKQCLTRYLFVAEEVRDPKLHPRLRPAYRRFKKLLQRRGWTVGPLGASAQQREVGLDWPAHAETMVGLRRLDNVEHCVTQVIRNQVPGDLVETGVWRGGTSIFMRALLMALGDTQRKVWLADSFQGLPAPNSAEYPQDEGLVIDDPLLAVSVDTVKANFARYGLLDDRVEFIVGWFKDTLGQAPIDRIAVLRLDGDLYESTMDSLSALYPKLSIGGYLIVDDYGAIPACRRAVEDYRSANGIQEPIEIIDWTGAYWQRRF